MSGEIPELPTSIQQLLVLVAEEVTFGSTAVSTTAEG